MNEANEPSIASGIVAAHVYQGGHVEYLKYMHDRLQDEACGHIRIFAGGGGVILPAEIAELEAYGIEKIYSPDDGRAMGLQGMINDLLVVHWVAGSPAPRPAWPASGNLGFRQMAPLIATYSDLEVFKL